MKILLINVVCKRGSTGKIVYDLYTELNKHGHEAAVCYGRGPKIKEFNIFKFSSNWEVYLHALFTRITGLHGCYSYFATKKLIKFIKKFEPDVVNLHQFDAYFLNEITLFRYLKNNNIKTVLTLHSENPYTGKCGYAYECNKWMKECKNCPQKREWPKSYFFDFTKYMFHKKKALMKDFNNIALVAPSKWLADRVKLSFLKDKRIKVIHNGIDLTDFHIYNADELKKGLGIDENEKILLHVTPHSLLNKGKGGKYIIELARKLEGKNIKIVVVGEKIKMDNFTKNIIQVDKIYDKCLLAQYYSMADLMVITSKKEVFPTVCLESLACGTPVIGFDAGGTAETTPDGYGLFVKYADVEMLKKKVLDYLDGNLILKSKKEYENFASIEYSKEKMFNNYFYLYIDIFLQEE
ncbi:MAG: glycosyltransferase [Streptococcaceae bacterium]|jgi:glycosyltransferase involved in cell wall biosynthesis|nr:glycosyltransferase [Streptococcaceae bacterium]